ncbi:hypothetical protein FHX09_001814 [Rhizobium sp. BK538]|nr:hypothetical protein [Rhizobium sp. BK538]
MNVLAEVVRDVFACSSGNARIFDRHNKTTPMRNWGQSITQKSQKQYLQPSKT